MKKCKGMCSGCRNNFYNGNNPYGIQECLCYKKAKVKKCIIIPLDACPPWNADEREELDCYQCNYCAVFRNYDKIRKGKYKGMKCYYGDRRRWECEE